MYELTQYLPFLILLIPLSIAIVIIVLLFKAEKKRTEALKQKSSQLGFSFKEKPTTELTDILSKFKLLEKGHSRKAYNLLVGSKNGKELKIFDYRYTVGYGKHSHTYNQTVFISELKEKMLPAFTMSPENFFHRLGDFVGMKDIDFDNYPVFSKKYLLKGSNEAEIRSLFNREIFHFFENENKKFTLEAAINFLLIFRSSKRTKLQQLDSFIQECIKIVDMFDR